MPTVVCGTSIGTPIPIPAAILTWLRRKQLVCYEAPPVGVDNCLIFYEQVIELRFHDCIVLPLTVGECQVKYAENEVIVKIVYREIFKSIETTLMGRSGNVQGTVKVIQGPGGAGKSMTLLYACHYARTLGWIVVYVPNLADFVSEESVVSGFAMELFDIQSKTSKLQLETIKEQDKGAKLAYEVLTEYELLEMNKTTTEEVWTDMLIQYMTGIRKIVAKNVLIAVDEWNCLFPHHTDKESSRERLEKHPARMAFKSDLLLAAPRRGVYMCDVSSALTNAKLPKDDDRFACNICVMNSDELVHFAQQYATFMGLSFDEEGLEKIVTLTSGIPALVDKLLGIVERAKVVCNTVDSSHVDKIDENAEAEFKTEVERFFGRYIDKLIMRISQEDHDDLNFVMYSILNIETKVCPAMFRAIGVTDSEGKPVSPFVRKVLARKISDKNPRIYEYLLLIGSPKVDLLETMFFAEWSQGYFREKEFETRNAIGTLGENVSFKFDDVIFQSQIPTSLEWQETLCERKILKLARGHPGLDFVGLTEQGLLILGQLSITNYNGSSHDVNKLLTNRRKLSAEEQVSQRRWGVGELNWAQYYHLCRYSPHKRAKKCKSLEFNGKMPKNTLYVYITTSTTFLTEQSRHANDCVNIIDGDTLKKCFPHWSECISQLK